MSQKPRFQSIAGNELYSKMHEHIRIKVVEAMKAQFTTYIEATTNFPPLPWRVSMKMFRDYGQADWDVDNLWIYHKAFLDTLKACKSMPDDSVLYVLAAGETEFVPVLPSQETKLIFTIESKPPRTIIKTMTIKERRSGKSGDILIEGNTIYVNVGSKKIIWGAAHDALRKAMFYCLNHFADATTDEETYIKYQNFFKDFEDYTVKLKIS